MSFDFDEDALAHILIQKLEDDEGERFSDEEYKQLLDHFMKKRNSGESESDSDSYNFEDTPEYNDQLKRGIIHNAHCCYLNFVNNHSYSKVHPFFSELLESQRELENILDYPQYNKLAEQYFMENDELDKQFSIVRNDDELREFIFNPKIDLRPLLRKKEDELFYRFKEYRESSMERFKRKEIINKYRLKLINEIYDILSYTAKDSYYYSLFSEYKNYNLSIINS
jgi:hypothetical protein